MKKTFKKALSILLSIVFVLGTVGIGGESFAEVLDAFSVKAGAANIESGSCGDNVTYTLDKDTGLLTISGTGAMKNYSSYAPWYSSRSSIKNVLISSGVTSIDNYAFYRCTGLKSITIPDSVTSIGEGAFSTCPGLESISIPNSVTSIGYNAFNSCHGLESITIPNSVTSIGEYAFLNCEGLTSITIQSSVTSIHYDAFKNCSEDLIICGFKGSTAETFALSHNFVFSEIVFSYQSQDGFGTMYVDFNSDGTANPYEGMRLTVTNADESIRYSMTVSDGNIMTFFGHQ